MTEKLRCYYEESQYDFLGLGRVAVLARGFAVSRTCLIDNLASVQDVRGITNLLLTTIDPHQVGRSFKLESCPLIIFV